jgi:hypothetical protein
MSERLREEFEDSYWQPGEVRTFSHINYDRGITYSAEYVMTVDGKAFGPVNERWTPITAITPRPERMIR